MVLKREQLDLKRIAPRNFGTKEWYTLFISLLLISNLAILLDIPYLRQILGFLFLTLLPGLLIIQILKLNKIDFLEKCILAWGLSISFLIFFGLLINNLSLSIGYETPLATIPLLISFTIAFVLLAIVAYKLNKDAVFTLPNVNLSTSEKAFLIVPILFPALSIFGMHVMNTTDNNIILMFLLFLIPIYVVFVCFFNQKFPKRLYPVVIFSISISLLLLLSLRSNHLIGIDTHSEYYFFRTTLDNLHWRVFGHSALDACLTISLLPMIYLSILNISSEFLFKILFSLIYSISPLVIYVISKKYVGESYAFLASCFFMFQFNFLFTGYNARTNTAILFFALAMMTLFSDKIDPLKKRILFIVFMASCMVSHYATTYIFFFIMLGTFFGIEILSKKYTIKKIISLTFVFIFFAFIFFWYSQVTGAAFNSGVRFVDDTLSSLNEFFIEESRAEIAQSVLGKGIIQKGIPHKIEFVFTWLTFALIGVGLVTLIRRYKEMSFPELNFKKSDFLKDKFEVGYFVIALLCAGLLVAMVALPYLAIGYNLDRVYAVGITILSVFFVIGGITLSKHFFFFKKRKPVLKEKPKGMFLVKVFTEGKKVVGKAFFSKERFEGKNALQNPLRKSVEGGKGLQVWAYLIILLVLIPYFLCVTGVMYNLFGVPRAITLNSEGEQADLWYIHDDEVIAAKWLNENNINDLMIYADGGGHWRLDLECEVGKKPRRNCAFFAKNQTLDNGYIYLRHLNVVEGKVHLNFQIVKEITDYLHLLIGNSKVYDNGHSEIFYR